jgi:hypothetical protein
VCNLLHTRNLLIAFFQIYYPLFSSHHYTMCPRQQQYFTPNPSIHKKSHMVCPNPPQPPIFFILIPKFYPLLRIHSFTHNRKFFYFHCYNFIEQFNQVWYNYNRHRNGRYVAESRTSRASCPSLVSADTGQKPIFWRIASILNILV